MVLMLNFRAQSLSQDTVVNVILPDDSPTENIPTLYLLHGMHGNHNSWLKNTRIDAFAQSRHIAVVMPDGENSFYHDMKYGKKFFTYIADELPSVMRRVFRLSADRGSNFIAGLSMGGYGALRTALLRPEQYAGAASLSGCADLPRLLERAHWSSEAAAVWGDDFRTCTAGTDSDCFHLIETFPDDRPKPKIFVACGTQDSLYGENVRLRDLMNEKGIAKGFDFTYEEGPGMHTWDFWAKWIGPAVDCIMSR